MAILLLLTRAVWANDYSQITTVQARIRASSMISYPPSDVLSFQLNGSLLSIIMLILKHDCVIIWSSLPSRGLCFKNYNMRVVLNRENEPLIFPLHFGSRRLKLHEIAQRKCKGEVTWSLNATYFCAAALQVKDTVKYREDRIITGSWSSLVMTPTLWERMKEGVSCRPSYWNKYTIIFPRLWAISIPVDSEIAFGSLNNASQH